MAPNKKGKGKEKVKEVLNSPSKPRRLIGRGKNAVAGVHGGGSTGGDEDGGSIYLYPTLMYRDERAMQQYVDEKVRLVAPGKVLNIASLETLNFRFLDQVRRFKWMSILGMNGNYCDSIVRHFYCNAQLVEGDNFPKRINSYVKGNFVTIDANVIAKVYGIPLGGLVFPGSFNVLRACQVVFEDATLNKPCKEVQKLGRDMRLLHLILVNVVKLRTGRLSRLSLEDIWMMCNIVDGRALDLCGLIMSVMVDCVMHVNKKYAYGCLITDLLTRLGVDMEGETMVQLHPSCQIGAVSLGRAGFVLVDGQWIKKLGSSSFPHLDDFNGSMPPTPSDWTDFMINQWVFQTKMRERLTRLEATVAALKPEDS